MEKHTYDADKDGRIEKDALKITLDKLLKGAGAGADPTEIAQFDILDKFRDFVSWTSLDGFTIGGDTGYAVAAAGPALYIATGATADYDAFIYSNAVWHNIIDIGKTVVFEVPLTYLNDNTLLNIWIRCAPSHADPPSETTPHFGWKIVNGALYASNADGTTQTITDTGVVIASGLQRTRLKLILAPGTNCKFYVNDVLKVTHTTNVPSGGNHCFHAHMRTLSNARRDMYIGRLFMEKEHA